MKKAVIALVLSFVLMFCVGCVIIEDDCQHTYQKEVITEASCTLAGQVKYTCSQCNSSYVEEVASIGHQYTKDVPKEASCVEAGEEIYTCGVCGISETKTVEPLGHDCEEATCTEKSVCSRCSEVLQEALGHTTTVGTCERCNTKLFEPIVYSGKGDKVISNVNLEMGIYKITLQNEGKRNFIVVPYDGSGKRMTSWANEIGDYTGSIIHTDAIKNGAIEVTSSGSWSITISFVNDGGTSNMVGSGDCVSPYFQLSSGILTVDLSYTGKNNFIVVVYDEYGNRYTSLANEIGNYSGQAIFNQGKSGVKYCMEVTASGEWSVNFGIDETVTSVGNK